jgi:hypothetical protein
MKHIFLLFLLAILYSCSESGQSSTRVNPVTLQSEPEQLPSLNDYTKKYIAEIRSSIEVSESDLTFLEAAYSNDQDDEYNCELDLGANRRFKYDLNQGQLFLNDDSIKLEFNKVEGLLSQGLIGSWEMIETTERYQIVTELIINDLEEAKLRKTCNLK